MEKLLTVKLSAKPTEQIHKVTFLGVCLLIAMAIFSRWAGNFPATFGYSYVLGWIACGFSLLAAIAIALVENFCLKPLE